MIVQFYISDPSISSTRVVQRVVHLYI